MNIFNREVMDQAKVKLVYMVDMELTYYLGEPIVDVLIKRSRYEKETDIQVNWKKFKIERTDKWVKYGEAIIKRDQSSFSLNNVGNIIAHVTHTLSEYGLTDVGIKNKEHIRKFDSIVNKIKENIK